jgi:hypothetical protein
VQDDFGLGEVVVSIFWFMLLMAWIWMIIAILSDIFRDHQLSGGGKALWALFIVLIPWLGCLIYLLVRDNSMNERSRQAVIDQQESMRAYVQQTAGTASVSDELANLANLRDNGTISAEEYEKAKAKVLA